MEPAQAREQVDVRGDSSSADSDNDDCLLKMKNVKSGVSTANKSPNDPQAVKKLFGSPQKAKETAGNTKGAQENG